MEWRLSPAPKPETRRRLKRRWGSCATGSLRPEALARGPGGGLAQSSGGRSPRDEDMRHCPEDRITRPLDEGPVRVSGGA